MQGGNLVHQLLVHDQPSGGVDYEHAEAFLPCLGERVLGDFHRILLSVLGEYGHSDLFSERAQLVYRGGAEGVAGGEHDLHAFLALEIQRELAAECGLSGTVETSDEQYGGRTLDVDFSVLGAHEFGQFVMYDLDHHLLGLDGCEHVGAHGLLLYPVAEVLGDLVGNVGVEQGTANLLEGLGYVYFGYLAFALQYLEGTLQSFGKVLKHILLCWFSRQI